MEKELTITSLQSMKIKDLTDIAVKLEIPEHTGLKKLDLIYKILEANAKKDGRIFSQGVLQVMDEGYGFLRSEGLSYMPGPDDVYISPSQIKRFGLRTGHVISVRSVRRKTMSVSLLCCGLMP